MAKVTLRLLVDPATGKRVVDIAYESDPDALPMEHEQEHRAIVQKVVGSLSTGNLEVERGGVEPLGDGGAREETAAEREKLPQ